MVIGWALLGSVRSVSFYESDSFLHHILAERSVGCALPDRGEKRGRWRKDRTHQVERKPTRVIFSVQLLGVSPLGRIDTLYTPTIRIPQERIIFESLLASRM